MQNLEEAIQILEKELQEFRGSKLSWLYAYLQGRLKALQEIQSSEGQ